MHPTTAQIDQRHAERSHELEAARLACAAFGIPQDDAEHMFQDPTGMALLVLLAASGANMAQFTDDIPVRHEHKRVLLRRAIRMASDWWATPHRYGDYADTCVYIETKFARFAYHCRKADPYLADLLANAPMSDRGWSGQAMQPYAERLALGWLAGESFANDVIAQIAAEQRRQ